MQGLASFVMRGQLQAALVAAVAAVSSLLVPPVLIISAGVVALVTLRRGGGEGLRVIALAGIGAAILVFMLFATVTPMVGVLSLFWVPVWLLAMALRSSVSLAWVLQLAAIVGGLAVLGFYLVLSDPADWWLEILTEVFRPILENSGLMIDEAALDESMAALAPLMPGIMVANILAFVLFGLLLGRWWQALLFNPGGFRQEFHELRLGQPMAVIAVAVFGLALTTQLALLINLALVLGLIYALQGIALVHSMVSKAGLARGWLIGFYVLMVFALLQILMLLCLLGIIDGWVDFRARIKPRA